MNQTDNFCTTVRSTMFENLYLSKQLTRSFEVLVLIGGTLLHLNTPFRNFYTLLWIGKVRSYSSHPDHDPASEAQNSKKSMNINIYIQKVCYIQLPPDIMSCFVRRLLKALKVDTEIKLQEILYLLGTEIFQFVPLEAEKSVFNPFMPVVNLSTTLFSTF